MASDPLSVTSILSHMAEALPAHEKGDTTSDLSSSYEAIALFTHACMTAVGFRLLGFTEGQKIESELSAVAPRLSPRWNDSYGSYSFLYAHTQSSLQYIIKIDRLGGKAEIRGLGLGDERIARFEIVAKDYISSSALPLRIPLNADGAEEDRSSLAPKLKDVFISEPRIADLAALFKGLVIQKLVPGLHKDGYEESAAESAREQAQDDREEAHARRRPRADPLADPGLPEPARPLPPLHDPLAGPAPRRPIPDFPPPGFEDEFELQRPARGGFGGADPYGLGNPYGGFGGDDLNPPALGPRDPLRGSFVPGGARPPPGGFGGMHPTFDDPLFAGRRGGGGEDPQVPGGARYDPVGPGEGPRDRLGRGRGGGGFPGGGGQGGLGGGQWPPNPFGGYGSGDFI